MLLSTAKESNYYQISLTKLKCSMYLSLIEMEVELISVQHLLEPGAGFSRGIGKRAVREQSTFVNRTVLDSQRTSTLRRYSDPDVMAPAKKFFFFDILQEIVNHVSAIELTLIL